MRQMIALEGEDERAEATVTNRWMVSYADFVTLLFVLFLVLYARSPKPAPSPAPSAAASQMRPARQEPANSPAEQAVTAEAARPPPRQALLDSLSHHFADLTGSGSMSLIDRKEGVVLEISDTSLFASGTAQPAPQAAELIGRIADAVGLIGNAVVVQGHTDNVPIRNSQYPSNWELSSARAASVVRALEDRGIRPERLTASGLAHTRPLGSNATEQGRRDNRRVSLIVLDE